MSTLGCAHCIDRQLFRKFKHYFDFLFVFDGSYLHQDELMANWEAAMNRKPLSKIEPLE